MKDLAIMVGIVSALSIIEMLFGKPVGFAVAATALIACVLFLWHAGKDAA